MRVDLNQQADFLPVSFSIVQQKKQLSTKKMNVLSWSNDFCPSDNFLSLKKPIFQQLS
jgi:hypothetical protein